MAAVAEADGLTKRWGDTVALADVTFSIGRGVTGLLGANGAGKTTLMSLLLGLHRPDAGRVRILGEDPSVAGVRARIGWSPDAEALPPDAPAHEVVRHLAEVRGLPRREATGRASDALHEVGLGEERFRPVGTMSTGERQRVKLAQAIAHDPDLVLLDEPTSGLDPVQRQEMLALVTDLRRRLGLDIVLSSHLVEEVERVSDAVVVLDAGRLVRTGSVADLVRTERDELVVEVDGPPDAAGRLATRLRRASLPVSQEGARLLVGLVDDAVYDHVRDALADTGIGVRRLERRRGSLHDVLAERAR